MYDMRREMRERARALASARSRALRARERAQRAKHMVLSYANFIRFSFLCLRACHVWQMRA